MIKRDKIFYSACGIFLVGVILGIMGYELGILFIVGAYLLRPTLHAFELADKYADERQTQIHSRAGNIAFIAVMIAAVAFALIRVSKGEYANEMYTIIFIGIGARALVGLFLIGELRRTGVIILIAIGALLTLFAIASAGISAPALMFTGIGLAFAAMGVIARKHPKIIALIVTVIAFVIFFGFQLYRFRPVDMALLTATFTMIISAACLILSSRPESESSGSKRSKTIRGVILAIGAIFVLAFMISIQVDIGALPKPGTAESQEIKETQGVSGLGPFEYYQDGTLEFCTLARIDTLSGQPLPAGTGVHFREDGVFDWCFLPENTEIQGYLCLGEGNGGFMTGFHPNGKLRLSWLVNDEIINGIPCQKFSFLASFKEGNGGTHFHNNGNLKSCCLSEDFTIEGIEFEEGDFIKFDIEGKLAAK